MDAFHFKVPLSVIKPQEMIPLFKDKWLLRRSSITGCLKALACSYYYFFLLFRKIKANFVFVDGVLDGLTGR